MSDEKLKALRQSHTLHPHPDEVRDPLFTSGSPFFDPRDLVQVKYELLRRVQVEGDSVAHATTLFALSRPTFYAAQAAWERAGLMGLFPEPTCPRSLPDPFWFRSATRTSTPSHFCETVNTRSAQPDFWLVAEYLSTRDSPAETGFYRVDHADQNEHADHDGDRKRPNG